MSAKEIQEIKYLKKISGISSFTIKGLDFNELQIQKGLNLLHSLYTEKFKPSNKDLWKVSTTETVLKEIITLFNKKVNSLSSKKSQEYYFPTKIAFGSLVKKNNVSNQKITSRYNIIPIYLIPTLIKLSFDYKNINDEENLKSWKEIIIKNEPTIEFIIADKPFIPQELFDYHLREDSENKGKGDFYLPLFDINEADKHQNLMLKYFKDIKDSRFPLNEKDDENIKNTDYLDSLELKEVNNDNLKEMFYLMKEHLINDLEKNNNILIKNGYELNMSKTLFSLSEKEVDVLYKAYCLIDDSITKSSVNIENKIAFDFFSKDDKKTLTKSEEEKIFFNSENHYGSFNINIMLEKKLISLALNQRIVLNTTSEKIFKEGDVLAVNGPPGTGKTTVLQSIVANMVTENIFDFIENKKGFIWDKNSRIKTPKLLNIGCSFTQQAVKNILNSLNFDAPKYNKEKIDLIWNKRWIYFQNKNQELGYVLDSSQSNENKNKIKFFIDNIDNIQDFFTDKYKDVFHNGNNIEQSLINELLSIKNNLNKFNLQIFKDFFFLNRETNQYAIKPIYYLSIEDIERQENENLENKKNIFNNLSNINILIDQNENELSMLRKNIVNYDNKIINLKSKDWRKINFNPIIDFVSQYIKLSEEKSKFEDLLLNLENDSLDKVQDKIIQDLIAEKNNISKEINKLKSELETIIESIKNEEDSLTSEKNNLKNIKSSFLSKLKVNLLGKDGNIKKTEDNLKNIKNELHKLKKDNNNSKEILIEKEYKKTDNEIKLNEKVKSLKESISTEVIKKEILLNDISQLIKGLLSEEIKNIETKKSEHNILLQKKESEIEKLKNEKEILIKEKEKILKKEEQYKNEKNEILKSKKEILLVFKTVKENLNLNIFKEFYYAKENIENLITQIDSQEFDLLSLYNDLGVILDNTLRYKCFQLSMRLKEWYFITLTKELSNLEDKSAYQAFNVKSKTFKNTLELYELNYFSLIFPLIISTLHSLGRKVSLYQNQRNVTLPGKIDNVIVDESGQISIEIGYIAAWNAKRLLCVGDTDQIKPVFSLEKKLDYFISKKDNRVSKDLLLEDYGTIKDNLGQVNCCETSLMNIAQKLTKYHQYKHLELSRGLYLVEHRRCPDEIIDYCNEIIYKGILIPKKGSFKGILEKENDTIKNNINKPWEFIKVNGSVDSNKNEAEAMAIYNYVEKLITNSNGKYSWENIGKDLAILSPFRNQANFILEFIKNKTKNKYNFQFGSNRLRINKEKDCDEDLIIGTVHALQGAEKKIILFSFVSSDLSPNSMVIKDKSILNVAISRSKLNIVLFGSEKVYENSSKELQTIRKYLLSIDYKN